jgi:signal transduction histidine kinase
VLERFHRGVGSVPGGSGLGLALVKETVMSLGGSVRVEPSPAGGARIVLELPRG